MKGRPMDLSEVPQPQAQAYRTLQVHRLDGGPESDGPDCVAEEAPVALEFNGISHAVMMATPADLEDFAYGFALTEGIVDSAAQIFDCEWTTSAQGYTLHVHIAAANFARLRDLHRTLAGRTGCGLCGTQSLAHAVRRPAPLHNTPIFSARAVTRAVASLRAHQPLLAATGASHAAAWCTADGTIALLREDVGRHNALDKLVGALLREGRPAAEGFIAITSRASFEMVQKTAAMGVGLLAAVSGVTGLAVDVAQAAGLTLLGFTRGEDASIYSHPARLNRNET